MKDRQEELRRTMLEDIQRMIKAGNTKPEVRALGHRIKRAPREIVHLYLRPVDFFK